MILFFNLEQMREARELRDSSTRHIDVFISFRCGEALEEAVALKECLEERGVTVFLCTNLLPGANLQKAIYTALERSKLAVLLTSETYGRSTTSFSTYHEMNYVLDSHKPFFLVKMCDEWHEPHVRGALGNHTLYVRWITKTAMPSEVMEQLMARLGELDEPTTPQPGQHGKTGSLSPMSRRNSAAAEALV